MSINITKKDYNKEIGFSRLELNIKGKEINHIIINSIRRIILSNIPTYAYSDIKITKNTSVFNNDYLKLRISNIPVWGVENNFDKLINKNKETTETFDEENGLEEKEEDIEDNIDASIINRMNMYVNYKNETNDIYFVTTDNAEFQYKSEQIKSPYPFPMEIVDLQPNQEITLIATAELGDQEISSIYSAVSVCFFIQNEINDYDFILESRGQIKEHKIIYIAIKLLIKKLHNFISIIPKNNKLEGIIKINDEEHTLGNLISDAMQKHESVRYFGYNVPHPMVKSVEMHYQLISGNINNIFKDVVSNYEKILEKMLDQIKKINK